ncbi:hypothetical protein [Mycobacterium sp. IDR2000157661]|uniref:hypothetical protein n=1 Tax=Mycobacterium sp. IDR2000157661 TaxID=2867005 RepID=UPI001EEAC90A|nr:hypothetical protein [Mycobacterium sp. IDR2000157661]ULE31542.1 hypothetical protein K3G64_15085 [Mycobacterium sp. IDR2000157661]
MRTGTRIAAFIVALATVFAVAIWVGKTVGPDGAAPQHTAPAAADEPPAGLQSTQDGHTLDLAETIYPADPESVLRFRILGADGTPVTRYDEAHDKLMHLIVVRNDLTAYQHLHPVLDPSGDWQVPADLSRPGDYRVFADFVPTGGPHLTLGANIHVGGDYDPRPLPAVQARSAVDGYTVTLTGTPKAGEASMLTLSVAHDGAPTDDLQPYLGAYGHLVALRAADLAYLHVHPAGESGDGTTAAGPDIDFHTTFPSSGDYRLFLDFQHGDVVRTAEFTVSVDEAEQAPATTAEHSDDDHGH